MVVLQWESVNSMRNRGPYRRYTDEIIRAEAVLLLCNKTYQYISDVFGIPLSTVGWHMLHTLKDIDPYLWQQTRYIVSTHSGYNSRRKGRP